jgi:predicted DNA-binding transcriptional regulator AlpA
MRPEPDPLPTDLAGNGKPPDDTIPSLAYRLDELADALGVSRRTLERERSAGRFPKPDRKVGKMPLWSPETIREWIGRGGK